MTAEMQTNQDISDMIHAARFSFALTMVDRQYVTTPQLQSQFGNAGYAKSRSDAEHNLAVLAEALAVADKGVFSRYILWLQGVLVTARVPAQTLPAHLAIMRDTLSQLLPPAAIPTVVDYIDNAAAALRDGMTQPEAP